MSKLWKSRLQIFGIMLPLYFGVRSALNFRAFEEQWVGFLVQSLFFAVVMMFLLGNSKDKE